MADHRVDGMQMYRILDRLGVPRRESPDFDLYLRSMAHTTDADTGPHGE